MTPLTPLLRLVGRRIFSTLSVARCTLVAMSRVRSPLEWERDQTTRRERERRALDAARGNRVLVAGGDPCDVCGGDTTPGTLLGPDLRCLCLARQLEVVHRVHEIAGQRPDAPHRLADVLAP